MKLTSLLLSASLAFTAGLAQAQERIRQMYEGFVADPAKMANKYRQRADLVGVRRAAVEFIAGMTDHYCESVYEKWFGRNA